jgi:small subunit ribosomal protein S16
VLLKQERIKHWLGVGATPSDRVAKFCAREGLIEPRPRPDQSKKPLPKAKAQERIKAAEAAAATASEAAAGAESGADGQQVEG